MKTIEKIQGERFGRLLVVGKVNVARRWEAVCKCDCGTEKVVSVRMLVRGDSTSCGCYHKQRVSEIRSASLFNHTFGKLHVVTPGQGIKRGKGGLHNNSWICKCECGATTEVTSNGLLSGNTTSCGCGRADGKRAYELRVTSNRSIAGSIMAHMRQNATRRDLEWSLTEDEFNNLVTRPCKYCGIPPQNTVRNVSQKKYHGLDRVDSSKGYVPGNVVSCCKRCNFAKHVQSLDEFKAHVKAMYDHMFNKKGLT